MQLDTVVKQPTSDADTIVMQEKFINAREVYGNTWLSFMMKEIDNDVMEQAHSDFVELCEKISSLQSAKLILASVTAHRPPKVISDTVRKQSVASVPVTTAEVSEEISEPIQAAQKVPKQTRTKTYGFIKESEINPEDADRCIHYYVEMITPPLRKNGKPVSSREEMVAYLNGHSKCFVTNGHFRLIYIDVSGKEGEQRINEEQVSDDVVGDQEAVDDVVGDQEELSVVDGEQDDCYEADVVLDRLIEASGQVNIRHPIDCEYRKDLKKHYSTLPEDVRGIMYDIVTDITSHIETKSCSDNFDQIMFCVKQFITDSINVKITTQDILIVMGSRHYESIDDACVLMFMILEMNLHMQGDVHVITALSYRMKDWLEAEE